MLNSNGGRMFTRLLYRTIIFFTMAFTAFVLMQPLTIYTGWPEVMRCTQAAAVLAWAEITIMWVRLVVAPRLDVQEVALKATDPMAAALVYATHQATWAVRLVAFIALYGVL
jgi:hypothetical protein